MRQVSILFRVLLLSAVLLSTLMGSLYYLGRQNSHHQAMMRHQEELLDTVAIAQSASKSFGDLKYWLTDLAVSLLMQSERRVLAKSETLDRALARLEANDTEAVADIRHSVRLLKEKAFLAIDAYSNDERVLGNSLMAAGRVHIRAAEREISLLVARVKNMMIESRDASLREIDAALRLSLVISLLAVLFGGALTVLIINSIRRTLAERDRLADDNEQTHQALADREMRLNAVLTTVADAIITIDRQGRIMTFNPAASRIFGYGETESIGRNIELLMRRDNQDDHDNFFTNFIDNGGAQPMAERREIIGRHKDGREFPVQIALGQMDVGGQRMYAGILSDVTELNRHESALVDARDSADLSNRAKTEFLANMSHELRTPLNAIIGFAEIMHLELFGSVGPPEYREYVIDIQNSGHHLLEVINDILDMSKIETEEMALTDAEVDIPKIVASSLRLVGERAPKSAVKLVNDGFDGLPKICADVRMFMQILLNPLSNAVKFTEPGGLVSISAKSMRRADCVSLSPTRASARHPTI